MLKKLFECFLNFCYFKNIFNVFVLFNVMFFVLAKSLE